MKCVSLFTGGGGFDIGLDRAGFDIMFATDLEARCEKTYRHPDNFGPAATFHVGDVTDVNRDLIEGTSGRSASDVALLVGGPPCPPYSKSRFYMKDKPRGLKDPVGDSTLNAYLRILEELLPKTFIFENVQGFTFKVHKEGFELLSATARRLGYHLTHRVVNCADYGIPQIRKRFIMVGSLLPGFEFPEPTHGDSTNWDGTLWGDTRSPWVTAGDVLSELDTEENADDTGHFAGGKHNHLLAEIPPGDNYLFFTERRGHPNPLFKWRSRYWSFLLKLSPDLPSWTIQARRSNNMGPLHWRNRILRIAEVKRLQTFPDDWYLSGTLEQQWRQVGNAAPPLLAQILGTAIARHLSSSSSKTEDSANKAERRTAAST